ncbi:hypothetical protein HPT25_27855 [Bacillus sp. BRMEA1]|uniref:hypothetical protein n=1 Tax=Neobacillus endophyticus TaxID=2738405 RepID=UPI00156666BC|nr:hypothetical protein [Neobacillus endophyticus]NRD81110.1 hypothetical protein [Neobacillus endophyticus]
MTQQIQETEKTLIKVTEHRMRDLFDHNDNFKADFFGVFNFYSQKFYRIIKGEEEQRSFDEIFFEAAKSQFLNGYYLAREVLADENSVFPDEFFTQPIGYLTEEVPGILKQAMQDTLDDMIRTDLTQKFIMWLLQNYEDVYDLVKQTIFDIACLGARQAFLDIKEEKNLENNIEPIEGWLSNLNDIEFLTPQLFLTPIVKNELAESWELHYWSTLNNTSKAGDVTILKITNDEKDTYLINIGLHQSIYETERQRISEYILSAISNRNNIAFENIVPNIAVIEDYYFFAE